MTTQSYDVGAQAGTLRPAERHTFTETKLGIKTSEFVLAVIVIAALLIASYIDGDDTLSHQDGWLYASLVAIGYILSRGLAKLGTREPYTTDR